MKTIYFNENTVIKEPTIVTIGNFDGIHLGHSILINKVVANAIQNRLKSVVITFEPHTQQIIKNKLVERLTTDEEKERLISTFDIDYLIIIPFTQEIANLSEKEFTERILVGQLNAKEIVMGEDHSFGKNNKKSIPYIDTINDISVTKIKLYGENSITAGSTIIRSYIRDGKIEEAVNLLGHPYLIQVPRVRGVQKGTELGFPTLNFSAPPSQKLAPLSGVYVAEVSYRDINLKGCLYIGDCPTYGDREYHLEFYSLDLVVEDPNINENCMIWIHHYIRPDVKFNNEEELVQQIDNDVKVIKNYFVKG